MTPAVRTMRTAARGRAEADGGQGVGQASDADFQAPQWRIAIDEWPDESLDGRVAEQKGYFAIIGINVLHRRSKVFEFLSIIGESFESSDKIALELDRMSRVRQRYMAEPPCATEVAETLLGYLIARRVTTIITRRKRDLRDNAVARNHVTSVVMAERPLKRPASNLATDSNRES